MPWWGWLIAFCVAAICLTVLGVVSMRTGVELDLIRADRPDHDPLWRSSETRQERKGARE